MRRPLRALLVAGFLVGCGGAGDQGGGGIMPAPETCGAVAPCGGDLTGTWKVLGGCVTPAETQDGICGQETFDLTTLSFSGTVTFTADMQYTATDFTEDRAEIDHVPSSCLAPNSDQTCADLDKVVKSMVNDSETGLSSAGCSGSTTCTCSIAAKGNTVIGQAGTYTLQGNALDFTTGDATTSIQSFDGFSYCVQNDLLHLLVAATTVDATGTQTTAVYQDIVAQKQ